MIGGQHQSVYALDGATHDKCEKNTGKKSVTATLRSLQPVFVLVVYKPWVIEVSAEVAAACCRAIILSPSPVHHLIQNYGVISYPLHKHISSAQVTGRESHRERKRDLKEEGKSDTKTKGRHN